MARTLEPGDTIAGYRIKAKLGRGGMATVYLAEDEHLKRQVALKVLSPELAADESFRRRFEAESERLASVDHPNIIPVYEAGEEDSLLFIAMRYVETTDLKDLIQQVGSLEAGRALTIVAQVASALDAAHAKGLVHRDVKPANILIAIGAGPEATDHAYLSDFGLTKRTVETSGLTRTGYFMGTIDYVAPEQISGKGVDGRTDQYALGCVLFESLAGQPPFPRDDDGAVVFAHLSMPPPSLTAIRPDLPPEIDAVIATAMAKEKEDRYPYCVAFARSARAAILGAREVTPPAGITSGENRMAAAIGASLATPVDAPTVEASPPDAGVEIPAPPPPSPVPTPPPPGSGPVTEPGPSGSEPRRRSKLLVPLLVAGALGLAAIGAFVVRSGGDGDAAKGGPTPGPTGASAVTGSSGSAGGPQLSEAQTFGTWNLTFSPAGDASTGSATETSWELAANCENRSGPHPCDVDAVSPVTGFIQRVGKTYEGTVTGELPCGPSDTMHVAFDVTDAEEIDGILRATAIRGHGRMMNGACESAMFTLVGSLG